MTCDLRAQEGRGAVQIDEIDFPTRNFFQVFAEAALFHQRNRAHEGDRHVEISSTFESSGDRGSKEQRQPYLRPPLQGLAESLDELLDGHGSILPFSASRPRL